MWELGLRLPILVLILLLTLTKDSLANFELEKKANDSEYFEDAHLTPIQLIKKYGYHGETHRVTTDDGYILEMHRITGPNSNPQASGKIPVLMTHSMLASSVDWIITGPEQGFGYILADEGYDVWLGNFRGNRFSRGHVKYSDLDKEYWQFSWHESGISDLPAMIDYILEKTSREQLVYVGYSMGATSFFVMSSELPEYQNKVKMMIALAPVARLDNAKSPFYKVLSQLSYSIETVTSLMGQYEVNPTNDFFKWLMAKICKEQDWTQPICKNIIFFIAGHSSDHMNTTMLPVFLAHTPAGGSVKQIVHYLQITKASKFQKYDYGFFGNWKKYHHLLPPAYDCTNITVPTSFHYASNDWLADSRDILKLYQKLKNPIGKFRVPSSTFSHLDFAWATDAKQLLFNGIIGLMKQQYGH